MERIESLSKETDKTWLTDIKTHTVGPTVELRWQKKESVNLKIQTTEITESEQ